MKLYILILLISVFAFNAIGQKQPGAFYLQFPPPVRSGGQTGKEKDLRIKGNRRSMIYHLPNCASYNRVTEKNIVWFKTVEEAERAGYRKAKNCR